MKDTKECNVCLIVKPLTEYYSQNKFSTRRGEYTYYRPECKDCTKNRSEEWAKNNRERFLEIKKSVNKNAPSSKNRSQKLNQKRKEEGYWEEYWSRNPEKKRQYGYNRMNKKHEISKYEWDSCKEYFDYRCAYCGLPISEHFVVFNKKLILSDFHKDHVDPNGANDLSNCVPSCKNCNIRKWEFEFEDWYLSQKFYSQLSHQNIDMWLHNDYKKFVQKEKSSSK